MSKKGCPLDIAVIENWHSLLKKETLHNNNYQDIYEYVNGVLTGFGFIKPKESA